jgi:hypothetical protein
MKQAFYTLVHGPMTGITVSAQGHLLHCGFDTSTAEQRLKLTAAAACYAWNGPPQPGLSRQIVHTNGDTSDCSFGNVRWEGLEPGFEYDTRVRHINGDLNDNRISNLFHNPHRSRPAACWAVPVEKPACALCHKKTAYGNNCPVDRRFLCRKCITAAALSASELPLKHCSSLVHRAAAIACMARVEVRVARGSKNAIARKMMEMRLNRAVVHIIAFDFANPERSLSVDAKAVIDLHGTLVLKGDVPKMALALAAGDSYIIIASRNQKVKTIGRAIVRSSSGDFYEVIDGFAPFDAFRIFMRRIV